MKNKCKEPHAAYRGADFVEEFQIGAETCFRIWHDRQRATRQRFIVHHNGSVVSSCPDLEDARRSVHAYAKRKLEMEANTLAEKATHAAKLAVRLGDDWFNLAQFKVYEPRKPESES